MAFDPLACLPRSAAIAVGAFLLTPTIAAAAVVPGTVVLRSGDVPAGAPAPVDNIRAPFVEPDGTVAFTGSLLDTDQFVWRGDQIIWLNSNDATAVLGTAEVSVGTATPGLFAYSVPVDGDDAIYTDQGVLAIEGAPGYGTPAGAVYTFNSRPTMAANGAVWWVAGLDLTGVGATQARALTRTPSTAPGLGEVVLQTGDVVGGFTLDATGIDFDYQISQDEQHLIAVLQMSTGSAVDDNFVYVDGVLVARESDPSGSGDLWDNFDLVTIDRAGNYAFSGDTAGPIATDEFIAYDGAVAIREGDVLDGITLASSAQVRFMALNDNGWLVHAWAYGGTATETMFLTCNPADPSSTQAVLTTGDELDTDGDGLGDGIIVTDMVATTGTPERMLGDDGSVYVEVDLLEGMATPEAMIRLQLSCCGNGIVDPGESCDDGNTTAGDGCSPTCQGATCGDGMVGVGEACDDGNLLDGDACRNDCTLPTCGDGVLWVGMEGCEDADLDDTDACIGSTCTLASCGDGFLWAGVEQCDDGNLDVTDACPGSCVPAFCGDGYAWAGMEECDDGNGIDTDDCLDNCVAASCGDGFVQAGVEDCDDLNADETDACLSTCVAASCGDGFVHAGVEMCDDGNLDDDDDCPSSCAPASCGDGFVQAGVEECDDANVDETDACLSTCVFAFCGDGFVLDGVEECDDGNAEDTDLCPTTCAFPICGDGFVLRGVEECDDANMSNVDGCLDGCIAAVCGDGWVQSGVEECDDGNTDDTDACANDCTLPSIDPDTSGGLDDTAGDSSTGGGQGSTGSASTGDGSGTVTDTDTDATAGAVDPGGCSCRSGEPSPRWSTIAMLMVLGLGATPRRRRLGRTRVRSEHDRVA